MSLQAKLIVLLTETALTPLAGGSYIAILTIGENGFCTVVVPIIETILQLSSKV